MKKIGLRLNRAHRGVLYITLFTLFISGLVWLYESFFLSEVNIFVPTSHALGQVAMQVHGGASMVFLVMLGTLLEGHIYIAWKLKKNITTGIVMLTTQVGLIVTGYLLYYVSSEALRSVVSVVHWVIGILVPLILFFHQQRYFSRRRS